MRHHESAQAGARFRPARGQACPLKAPARPHPRTSGSRASRRSRCGRPLGAGSLRPVCRGGARRTSGCSCSWVTGSERCCLRVCRRASAPTACNVPRAAASFFCPSVGTRSISARTSSNSWLYAARESSASTRCPVDRRTRYAKSGRSSLPAARTSRKARSMSFFAMPIATTKREAGSSGGKTSGTGSPDACSAVMARPYRAVCGLPRKRRFSSKAQLF
jgi:hypothetical protein